jgi:hypothetical protein
MNLLLPSDLPSQACERAVYVEIFGKEPTSQHGTFFDIDVMEWIALLNFLSALAPEVMSGRKFYPTEKADDLDAATADALATRLERALDYGVARRVALVHASKLEMLPNQPCALCRGTGRRNLRREPPDGTKLCGGCKGGGFVRPAATLYPFNVENLHDFTGFLRSSGGFTIARIPRHWLYRPRKWKR